MNRPERTRETVTSSEAAAILGVERRTVIRMEQHGVLMASRPYPNAHRRFLLADVEALLPGGGDQS